LKLKPLFSFSRKAKISENSLTFREIWFCKNFRFRENFRFCESFRENFCFREKFLFPGWFSRKFYVTSTSVRIWIHIQVAPGSGSALRKENFRENFRETENFRENFRETKNFRETFRENENFRERFREIFATFCKLFSRKAKNNFREIFAKIR
jgi:hypothetical protein